MTVLATFSRSVLEQAERPLTDATLLDVLGGSPTDAGISVSPEGAMRMTAVYRAVAMVSGVIAGLPLHAYRHTATGRERVELGFLEEPAEDLTPYELWEHVGRNLLVHGNAYLRIYRDGLGRVRSLWPLHPPFVTPERLAGDGPRPKRYRLADGQVLTADQVMHVPGLSYDGISGLSPIALARQGIGLSLAAEAFGARMFGRGALVPGALQTDLPLEREAAERLQADWAAKTSGGGNQWRVPVLHSGAKFVPIALPPADVQYIEARKFGVTEIARLYGLPPHLLGDVERSTSWGCLASETPVLMADGRTIRADHVRSGDKVIGWNGEFLVPAAVEVVAPRPPAPRRRVVTAAGRCITVTTDHPFWALRPERVGHSITTSRQAGWIQARHLEIGSHVLPAVGAPISASGDMGADEAWLVGLFIGGGHVQSNGNAQVMVGDPGTRSKLERVVASLGGSIAEHPRPQDGNSLTMRVWYGSPGAPGRRCSLRLLLDLAAGRGSEKTIPDAVMASGPEAWAGFLAGWFDADGCAKKLGCVWDTIGHDLASRGQQLLANLGMNASIDGAGPYRLAVRHKDFRNILRVAVGTHVASVKRDSMATVGPSSRPHAQGWDRVISVEDLPAAETIAIQIESGINSHVTAGLVTHNTGIEQQNMQMLTFMLDPLLVRLEQRVSRLAPTGVYCRFSRAALLRADTATRYLAHQRAITNGWESADEIRALEEMDPIPGGAGQQFWRPANLEPVTGSDAA